jgi:hypothetical protein
MRDVVREGGHVVYRGTRSKFADERLTSRFRIGFVFTRVSHQNTNPLLSHLTGRAIKRLIGERSTSAAAGPICQQRSYTPAASRVVPNSAQFGMRNLCRTAK